MWSVFVRLGGVWWRLARRAGQRSEQEGVEGGQADGFAAGEGFGVVDAD